MKKNILIASSIAAGAAALFYLIKRNRKAAQTAPQLPFHHTRHRTEIFAKAKHSV